jgi:C-terminal processing protease CtpA/Prc
LRAHDELVSGDEIVSVDGRPVTTLRPVTLARLEPVLDNPNFGPVNSEAKLRVLRAGRFFDLNVKRIARPSGFKVAVAEHPRSGIVHLRFFALDSYSIPMPELRRLWEEIPSCKGLVLDLRDCFGGNAQVAGFIARSLLGPSKPLFRNVPRVGSENKESIESTDSTVPRFEGPVALITNRSTESEPEMLAAVCQEYGRARLFGERTAGAFHGWTVAIDTPENWLRYAIPYTKSISPKGIDYEGKGIKSDNEVRNTVADYRNRKDKPLEAALQYLKTKESR